MKKDRLLEFFYILWFILVLSAYMLLVIVPKIQGKI
jgi:hypothetical protein